MLRDMEGRLNQIQSSETLWSNNKALTYGLQMNCFLFSLSLLFASRVFNLQREVWNERANVCVWNVRGICGNNANQFDSPGV